jgi:DNA invertase Pin-like site-specific DNA recombinase
MPATITPQHLSKIAYVYVRQSTPQQVKHNLLSQQLQYDLVDLAKAKGWAHEKIIVVDEDLGKSAAGTTNRQGFETILTNICLDQVGALFCAEASRLARNGREWHQLLEFCSVSDIATLIIDHDGVYDPHLPSDRLMLGVKGTVSLFELDTFRKRAQDAIRKKAQAGQLWTAVPAAFNLTEDDRCEINPDLRIQQAIQLVFQKFRDFNVIRQVRIWCGREMIEIPVRDSHLNNRIIWRLPTDNTIRHILTNPLYAGAYVYPKSKVITRIVDGKPVKSTVITPPDQYLVVIRDLFPSYISWEEFQQNQKIIANNAFIKADRARGATRNGEALLAGLVFCQRCSRRMRVRYRANHETPNYICRSDMLGGEVKPCPSLQGRRLEQALLQEVFNVLQPHAIQAALLAEEHLQQQLAQKHKATAYALEQARYEAERIKRQLDAVEPEKGFVFRELTKRWEQALANCHELEQRQALETAQQQPITPQERSLLFNLAKDFNCLWNHPTTTNENKKRLLRTLIDRIWVQVQEDTSLSANIHWHGGVHTELVIKHFKPAPAKLKEDPNHELVHVVKQLALCANDTHIARVLNRLKRKTPEGRTWAKYEVAQFRQAHQIPAFSQAEYQQHGWLNLKEAAQQLGLSTMAVKKLIKLKIIPAEQVVPYAPWVILRSKLDDPHLRSIVEKMKQRHKFPLYNNPNQLNLKESTPPQKGAL